MQSANLKSGYTLIEVILYMALVSIFLTAVVSMGWGVIRNGAKSETQQEVFGAARYISERIKYEIRNAADLDVAGSTFGSNPGTLSLCTSAGCATKNKINVTSSQVMITVGAASPVAIQPTDTKVTDLTFTNYTSSNNKTKHVAFTLTVTQLYSGTSQTFKADISLRSSAEVRSN